MAGYVGHSTPADASFSPDGKTAWEAGHTITGVVFSVNSTTPDINGNVVISTGGVQSIVAGTNITVDASDPAHPIVAASGGGAVTSVNGKVGAVTLHTGDITPTSVTVKPANTSAPGGDPANPYTFTGSVQRIICDSSLISGGNIYILIDAAIAAGDYEISSATGAGDAYVSTVNVNAPDAPSLGTTWPSTTGYAIHFQGCPTGKFSLRTGTPMEFTISNGWQGDPHNTWFQGEFTERDGYVERYMHNSAQYNNGHPPIPTTGDAGKVVTVNGTEDGYILAASSGGIPDAPSDGNIYVRRNGAWEVLNIG